MATTALSTEISERDLFSVRQLLEDVRTQERAAQLFAASITWLNAFTSFKRARRRYGLPHDSETTLYYSAVLAELKTTGQELLASLRQGKFSLDQAPVDERGFAACVAEMEDDDRMLQSGLLHPDADLSDVEAVLGKA